uniref:Post-GPI attachment to proteins factor 3 n=1 Tax=Dracunculus medinensis TaxID=318479 RepID=A0A0N4UM27_DRAME
LVMLTTHLNGLLKRKIIIFTKNLILDFPPLFWLIDAHALFHLATVPLPIWMTKFILLESSYELRQLNYNKMS